MSSHIALLLRILVLPSVWFWLHRTHRRRVRARSQAAPASLDLASLMTQCLSRETFSEAAGVEGLRLCIRCSDIPSPQKALNPGEAQRSC